MLAIWVVLSLALISYGADWSGAQWDTLVSRDGFTISPYFETVQCTDDTLYFITGVDTTQDGFDDFWWFCQVHFNSETFRDIPLPEEVAQNFAYIVGYSSWSREYPALQTRSSVWRMTDTGWDSLHVLDSQTGPDLCSFAFDSSGTLHYLSGAEFTSELEYHRQPGLHAPRDTVFECHFEEGFPEPWFNRIWSPVQDFVVIATGAHDAGSAQPLWNSVFYYSEGDEPFGGDSTGVFYGMTPRVLVSEWGEWCYGLIRTEVDNRSLWIRTGRDRDSGSWLDLGYRPVLRYRFATNPVDSTFEVAIVQHTDSSRIQLLIKDFDVDWWEEDTSIVCPGMIRSLGFLIDHSGEGHLLAVTESDPSTILHFGPVQAEATERFRAVPVRLDLDVSPNPFNSTTRIRFDLPKSQHVHLSIYDLDGRLVQPLADGWYATGQHELVFDAIGLSSGTYFVHLRTPESATTKKLLLIR